MSSPGSLHAGGRSRRTALGQLISMWAALPRSIRRFVADFAAVMAEEGRDIPGRLATTAIAVVIAAIVIVCGWLLLCVATAAWLVSAQAWRWEMALYLVAVVNLAIAVIAILATYRGLKSPFFPVTTYELQRLREANHEHAADEPVPEAVANAGPRERALIRSEADLEARLAEVRRATPLLIATPSVIAATAGVGFALGYISANPRRSRGRTAQTQTRVPLTRQLLNIAFGQLSSLAVAAALREFQRRAGDDRSFY